LHFVRLAGNSEPEPARDGAVAAFCGILSFRRKEFAQPGGQWARGGVVCVLWRYERDLSGDCFWRRAVHGGGPVLDYRHGHGGGVLDFVGDGAGDSVCSISGGESAVGSRSDAGYWRDRGGGGGFVDIVGSGAVSGGFSRAGDRGGIATDANCQ